MIIMDQREVLLMSYGVSREDSKRVCEKVNKAEMSEDAREYYIHNAHRAYMQMDRLLNKRPYSLGR